MSARAPLAGEGARTVRWTAAVLTGGASRRMGRDKATLTVGDRPLAAVAAEALHAAGAVEVVLVGGDLATLASTIPGVRVVPDRHPGEGPLGGILTAFAAASAVDVDLVAVVACDMPGFRPETASALVEAAATHPDAAVVAAVVDDRPQPLTAVWRPALAEPALQRAYAAGERAPRRVLPGLAVVGVLGLDHDVVDVDSPADIARYAEGLRPQPAPGSPDAEPLADDEAP